MSDFDLAAALQQSSITPAPTDTGDGNESTPSYLMTAIDNHNYGNGNQSWYDPSTWEDDVVGAGKFAAVSAASGLNSFYNTGVTVANWFGADAEQNDVTTQLSALDDNLGQYYQEHKAAADLVGFIATSFIPGLGSVKVLNAGQKLLRAGEAGWIGSNLSKATGLLAPNTAKYVTLAAEDIAQSSATFSTLNTNVIKALVSGYGQAALESAVFETAVTATMFKSPILEDQDIGDLMKNIAVGTLTGGFLGGTFTAAKTYSGVKKLVTEADKLEKPFTTITELPGASVSDRVISRFSDLDTMKSVPIDEQSSFAARYEKLSSDKEIRLMNLARQDMHVIAGGDSELANTVMDSIVGADSKTVTNNLLNSQEITRIGTLNSVDRAMKESIKTLDVEGVKGLKNGFVKIIGEDAGALSFTEPTLLSIADVSKDSNAVLSKVKSYDFRTKELFNLAEVNNHTEAEARYIWADKIAKLTPDMNIHEYDIPLLERALNDKFINFNVVTEAGSRYKLNNTQELFETLNYSKDALAKKLLDKSFTTPELAKITNTKLSYIEGTRSSIPAEDLLARQDVAKKYTQQMIDKGLWNDSKGIIDISTKPTYFKIAYDTKAFDAAKLDNNTIDAMTYIKAKSKVYQDSVNRVVAANTGNLYSRLYHPNESLLLSANRYGAGPGLFANSNGAYGSLESWTENIGAATNALIKNKVGTVSEKLTPVAYKLANKPEAAIEFESINNKIASTTEKYILNEDGTALIPRKIAEYRQAIADGESDIEFPKLQEGAPEEIPIQNIETAEAIAAHIETKGARTRTFQDLRGAQGLEDNKDGNTFYPIRPNPKNYPHFAFVVDPTVTGSGHVSMIHAASEKELEAMIDKVPSQLQTITKAQSEEFHKAMGDYSYDRTLHENYIDSSLKSNGVNNQFFQKTDPQKIANDFLEDHTRGEAVLARELVNAKFEKEFSELRRLGEQYTNVASSKYGGTTNVSAAEASVKNPYLNYVKTALDISQMSEHPLLQGFNSILDKSFSKAAGSIRDIFVGAKSPEDLDKVNAALQKYGVKSGYYDAALNTLANHSAPQGLLKTYITKANGILSTMILGDPLNAINNSVGAQVLLGAETNHVVSAIKNANPAVAGKLADLAHIGVPGTTDTILSPLKLIAKANSNFLNKEAKTAEGELLSDFYKRSGFDMGLRDQRIAMMDDLTLKGNESAGDLSKKLNAGFAKAQDAIRKYTGNDLAEHYNRFVAADVMRQLTDLGIESGVMDSSTQLSYINSFVNKTQGNIIASQRPLMFQGPIGSAIGLFQSYQFNMMQQMLKYVGEGSAKDAAMMLGLQGTMYGMNGLPAFNFINQHIVGTASGNPTHKDLYTATYGTLGKNMGDWLMYGAASNLLHANLYSRGDINPRQLTIIPTNPVDIPIYQATAGFLGNIKDTVGKIQNGGNVWETLLQGLEHNTISRPLAGLAQTLQSTTGNGQVMATSRKGDIMGSNDLLSWATISRLSGGKPLDDAIVNDETYRIGAYQAYDHKKVEELNEAIKTSLIAGQHPEEEQVGKFVKEYAALGGKQLQFNQHMMGLYKQTNTAQANRLAENLSSPYSQSMQAIMGGNEVSDGRYLSN